ncbi:MAG TPA: transcription factor, partial [Methanocorpusculum sp.]|nr:transcription factor [Methanocorpusculum sp.]
WLTYLWVMRMDNLHPVLRAEMETAVEKLSARLRYDEANDCYQCKNCGLTTTFNNACTTNFVCEQCGEMLVHFDDDLLVSALRNRVEKMRRALSDV